MQEDILRAKVFSQFEIGKDIVRNQKEIKTLPLFSNNNMSLGFLYTSSFQTSLQKQYYLDVVSSPESKNVEFSIAYGHIDGSGSLSGSLNTYPSKAIYSQYKQLLLEPGETLFKFADGTTTNHIYVINFKTERFKQRIDPGNWSLMLSMLNGDNYPNNQYTGSNIKPKRDEPGINYRFGLYDDSNTLYDKMSDFLTPKKHYNIVPKPGMVQWTFRNPVTSTSLISVENFGLFYPEMGVMVLDANRLDKYFRFNTVTGSNINGDNPFKLFVSLRSSAVFLNGQIPFSQDEWIFLSPTQSFTGRCNEIENCDYYFCRIKNTDYNFSNNPSFYSGSGSELSNITMINDPKVYITSVGLYNNRQELLAVAKISKPILKTFETELNLKVKIKW